ncbi:MAG: NADPH-dependent FMN reductase [Candidatus Marinimicrobia bacterium]|nr:NADPH-dependent FMN reductase [Candidatus Neomarinimicrobiota bacterium]
MSKILIVSSTKGNNLVLAKKIGDCISLDHEIISLEDFGLPLYMPKTKINKLNVVKKLSEIFIQSNGFIFCSPEYNGGSPPILTNAITWLSVTADNWRGVFNNKKAIIATHSGGSGFKFLTSFRFQLEHLGTIVYPRNIIVNKGKKFSDQSVIDILNEFEKLI